MPVWPVWNSAGTPRLLQRLVQRVDRRGRWARSACRLGWNLNPRTPCSLDQPAGQPDAGLARGRVDRAERDEHVGVLGGAASAISSLDSAGCPVAVSASTVKTTAAMFRPR